VHTVIRQHHLRIPQDEELFDELASVRLTSPPLAPASPPPSSAWPWPGDHRRGRPRRGAGRDWRAPLADVKLAANINAALAGSASPGSELWPGSWREPW